MVTIYVGEILIGRARTEAGLAQLRVKARRCAAERGGAVREIGVIR